MLGLFESFYGYAVSKFQVPVALLFGLRRTSFRATPFYGLMPV